MGYPSSLTASGCDERASERSNADEVSDWDGKEVSSFKLFETNNLLISINLHNSFVQRNFLLLITISHFVTVNSAKRFDPSECVISDQSETSLLSLLLFLFARFDLVRNDLLDFSLNLL